MDFPPAKKVSARTINGIFIGFWPSITFFLSFHRALIKMKFTFTTIKTVCTEREKKMMEKVVFYMFGQHTSTEKKKTI